MSVVAIAVLAVESSGAQRADWLDLARSLSAEPLVQQIYWCGFPPNETSDGPIARLVATPTSPWDVLSDAAGARSDAQVAIMFEAPTELPPRFVTRAVEVITSDRRNALVSFVSDRPDHTCLFDEDRAGRRRGDASAAELTAARVNQLLPTECAPVRLDRSGGWVQAVNVPWATTFAPGSSAGLNESIRDASRAAIARGFRVLLDPTVYLPGRTPADASPGRTIEVPPDNGERLQPGVFALLRSRVFGLDIAIDATCLGPVQSGTQVQVVELVTALAAEPRVRSICVATGASGLPAYAEHLGSLAKVGVTAATRPGALGCGPVDIIHRPFQPRLRPPRGPWGRWSQQSARTVLTVLDLINFDIPEYVSAEDLVSHRRVIALGFESVDRVITISADVADEVVAHGFDLPADRLSAVPLGADHLGGSDAETRPATVPLEITSGPFLLVVGTDLLHKNRDLAIKAWLELKNRGHADLGLVLLGHHMETGSSDAAEAAVLREYSRSLDGRKMLRLDHVPGPERNWLLRHAAIVLYPTSAEGFGLVPFEAAQFGTPTVWVPFGPLAELLPHTRGTAKSWSPIDLADAAETLLRSADVADESVRAVRDAGSQLTWELTATRTVDAYLAALATPKRAAHLLAGAEQLAMRARRFEHESRTPNDRSANRGADETRRMNRLVGQLRRITRPTPPEPPVAG